jgi:CubicO group peptidase (beta-lactamase class C family)
MESPLIKTVSLIEEQLRQHENFGAQLFVSRNAETIADLAMGNAAPHTPMRTDTILPWLSSGKPIAAVAVAQLCEKQKLELDDPVSKFIPPFGVLGKEAITIRHLLTHTGGFRSADKIPESLNWTETITRICQTPLEPDWIPGEKAGYHVSSSWFILAEILQRISGTNFENYVLENFFGPIGVANSRFTFSTSETTPSEKSMGRVYVSQGADVTGHPTLNQFDRLEECQPGSGARGPIRDLGKFYEFLLRRGWTRPKNLSGEFALKSETIRIFAQRHRIGLFDHTFLHTLDWGLGFIPDSNRYGMETVPYGYGRRCSPEAFGHSGAQSSCAFADPTHGLVVAWVFNFQPGERAHQRRAREINSAIYEDLKNS